MTMTDDSSALVWHAAQRLLNERGRWTTDSGAYLESEQVTVLVHPVLVDDGDRARSLDAVDLVVAVRPRIRCELPPGAGVTLVGGAGSPLFRLLGDRGQAVFRRLPAGTWTAQLVDGAAGSVPSPQVHGAEVLPLRTIPRLLAAAAGDRPRAVREVYTGLDGQLTTEVVETPEARLVIRISTVEAPSRAALARLHWAVEIPNEAEVVRTLVVPLASTADHKDLVATYDLGPLDLVKTVRIGPAEWAEPSELTGQLVRDAFDVSLYGNARRAWEELAVSGLCPPAAQAVLHEMLET